MKFFSQYWIPQYCTILHFTSDRGKIWSFSNHHEIPNCTASGRASTRSWWLSFHLGDIWCTFAGVSPDGDQTSYHQMVIRPLFTRFMIRPLITICWDLSGLWPLQQYLDFAIFSFPDLLHRQFSVRLILSPQFSNLSPTSPRPTSLSDNLWLPGRTVGPVLVVGAVHLLLLLPQLLLLFTFYYSNLQHFSCFSFLLFLNPRVIL